MKLRVVRNYNFYVGDLVVFKPLNIELVVTDITDDFVTAVTPGDFDGEATQYTETVEQFEKVNEEKKRQL